MDLKKGTIIEIPECFLDSNIKKNIGTIDFVVHTDTCIPESEDDFDDEDGMLSFWDEVIDPEFVRLEEELGIA